MKVLHTYGHTDVDIHMELAIAISQRHLLTAGIIILIFCNINTQDNVDDAVITIKYCESSIGLSHECRIAP